MAFRRELEDAEELAVRQKWELDGSFWAGRLLGASRRLTQPDFREVLTLAILNPDALGIQGTEHIRGERGRRSLLAGLDLDRLLGERTGASPKRRQRRTIGLIVLETWGKTLGCSCWSDRVSVCSKDASSRRKVNYQMSIESSVGSRVLARSDRESSR